MLTLNWQDTEESRAEALPPARLRFFGQYDLLALLYAFSQRKQSPLAAAVSIMSGSHGAYRDIVSKLVEFGY